MTDGEIHARATLFAALLEASKIPLQSLTEQETANLTNRVDQIYRALTKGK